MTQPSLLDVPTPRRHRIVRETSIASYAEARERLRGRAADVLRFLGAFWNARQVSPTSAELDAHARSSGWMTLARRPMAEMQPIESLLYIRRGLSDLQTKGLVETVETRECFVSGSRVHSWRVTQR